MVAEKAQTDRCREVADPVDFYGPTSHRFRYDPAAGLDAVGRLLESRVRPLDTWLDIGAGGGRYTLPLARLASRVIAVDPSPSMLDILRVGMIEADVANVEIVGDHWPPDDWATDVGSLERYRADVGLVAHVGYDIEDVGPFLDALESAVNRLCVAVMGESAMTTVGARYWEPVHGEPRVPLPSLPDLLVLLLARGRLPEVTLVDREPPTYDSFESLHDRARRQLWLRPDSARDVALEGLLRTDAREIDGMWVLPEDRARIGVVTWPPPERTPLSKGT